MDRMDADEATRDAVWESFREGDLSFLFHDAQLDMLDVLLVDANEYLIFCSRQLGKSFFILCIALMHCAKPYGRRKPLVRVFCETTKQIEDIVNDNMQLILPLAPPGWIKRTKSENRWKVGVGEIRLCPLAKAHVDGKRGGNATLIILEEGCVSKSDNYRTAIGSVVNPQLLRSRGAMVHVTTPSKDVGHYIHKTVLPKCRRVGAYVNRTVYQNPQLLDEQILEAFDRCTSLEEWDREYLCKIVKDEMSTVIPEFDEDLHVRALKVPTHAHWQTGLDFGGVRDKHGLLLSYYDFERAKLCIKAERLLPINTPTKKIIAEGLAMEQAANWLTGRPRRVSDCPGQILVDLRTEGFVVRTPEKEKGSWEAGINALRLAFSRGEIEIDPACVMLIQTLELGQYTENRKDFERTEELGHLDLIACLIYLLRHKNVSNPFPKNLGKHKETHRTDRSRESSELAKALLPDFLK